MLMSSKVLARSAVTRLDVLAERIVASAAVFYAAVVAAASFAGGEVGGVLHSLHGQLPRLEALLLLLRLLERLCEHACAKI